MLRTTFEGFATEVHVDNIFSSVKRKLLSGFYKYIHCNLYINKLK